MERAEPDETKRRWRRALLCGLIGGISGGLFGMMRQGAGIAEDWWRGFAATGPSLATVVAMAGCMGVSFGLAVRMARRGCRRGVVDSPWDDEIPSADAYRRARRVQRATGWMLVSFAIVVLAVGVAVCSRARRARTVMLVTPNPGQTATVVFTRRDGGQYTNSGNAAFTFILPPGERFTVTGGMATPAQVISSTSRRRISRTVFTWALLTAGWIFGAWSYARAARQACRLKPCPAPSEAAADGRLAASSFPAGCR